MVMGVYYFLWIILGSNLMTPYGYHMRTISQISRFEGATERRPNKCLSFFCFCGRSRSAFLNQKNNLDENSDPVVLTNSLKRLKKTLLVMSKIIDPHEKKFHHLQLSGQETEEEIREVLPAKINQFIEIQAYAKEQVIMRKAFDAIKGEGHRRKSKFLLKLDKWGDQRPNNFLLQNVNLHDSMIDHLDLKFELDKLDQYRPSKK